MNEGNCVFHNNVICFVNWIKFYFHVSIHQFQRFSCQPRHERYVSTTSTWQRQQMETLSTLLGLGELGESTSHRRSPLTTNGWATSPHASDLRPQGAHYDGNVMGMLICVHQMGIDLRLVQPTGRQVRTVFRTTTTWSHEKQWYT